MSQPLSDVLVVDLSRALAGPFCTMLLGDLGADVIKIEMPGAGDDTRQFGPPFVEGESAYYLFTNRNKRSITVNLKSEKGQEIVRELARRGHVLVENFRRGSLERMGLGYEQLRDINPGLVYCSISAYGADGPYRDLPGYDFTLQAVGGLMSITGEPDGQPTKVGISMVDLATGMFALTSILAALRVRDQTGRGQRLEVSLLESVITWLTHVASNYLVSGHVPSRHGNAHANIVPYQSFPARDGLIVVAVANDGQWNRFCNAVGRPELAQDPRYAANPDRVARRAEVVAICREVFVERDVESWLQVLRAADVPCAPVNSVDQVFADPQVQATGIVQLVDHPTIGTVKMVGCPFHFSETPTCIRRHPPLLGEHTQEVLVDMLGYAPEAVSALKAAGVV